jgi:hypothetical protein
MSVPQNSSYWSEVYQACEPCYSKGLGGANQCIFTPPADPRDDDYYDWLMGDDVVIPDGGGHKCAEGTAWDPVILQCRAGCPGEGTGGQQFYYYGDWSGGAYGECQCDESTPRWVEDTKKCVCDELADTYNPTTQRCDLPVPKMAGLGTRRGDYTGRVNAKGRRLFKPGDPFPPCSATGLNHGCWYREDAPGDLDNCLAQHEVTLQAKRLKAVMDAQNAHAKRLKAIKKK